MFGDAASQGKNRSRSREQERNVFAKPSNGPSATPLLLLAVAISISAPQNCAQSLMRSSKPLHIVQNSILTTLSKDYETKWLLLTRNMTRNMQPPMKPLHRLNSNSTQLWTKFRQLQLQATRICGNQSPKQGQSLSRPQCQVRMDTIAPLTQPGLSWAPHFLLPLMKQWWVPRHLLTKQASAMTTLSLNSWPQRPVEVVCHRFYQWGQQDQCTPSNQGQDLPQGRRWELGRNQS